MLDDSGFFGAKKRELVQTAAEVAKLRHKADCLEALFETALDIVNHRDIDQLLNAILVQCSRIAGAPHGFIAMHEPADNSMVLKAKIGLHRNVPIHKTDSNDGIVGAVWKEDRIVAVGDYPSWERRISIPELDYAQAAVGIPIRARGEVIGVLALFYAKTEGVFDQDQVELMERVGRLAAIAMDNATLHVSLQQELQERKQSETRAKYLIYHDAVTGIPNRRYFQEQVAEILLEPAAHLAVLMLEIRGLSLVNDMAVEAVSLALQMEVAARLKELMPPDSVLANVWGHKFLLAIPDYEDSYQLCTFAEELLEAFEQPWVMMENEYYLTASVGICTAPEDGTDIDTLMKHVDLAVDRTRHQNNTYQFYTPQLAATSQEQLLLEKHLRHALERQEFYLHFQPRMDLHTGALASVEALLRWKNGELGLVPPGKFVPLAEEIGIMEEIGEWVLQAACEQAQQWQEQGMCIPISVNLSASQFRQPDLAGTILRIVQAAGLEPNFLELEITETMVIEDIERAILTMQQLKEFGMKIAMDDFGMGQSSLNNLKRLPVDVLKIDKCFVYDAEDMGDGWSIAQAIVRLGHLLHLRVTAEGVETSRQLSIMRKLGCDEVQGYLFSRPVLAEEIAGMVKKGKMNLFRSLEDNKRTAGA